MSFPTQYCTALLGLLQPFQKSVFERFKLKSLFLIYWLKSSPYCALLKPYDARDFHLDFKLLPLHFDKCHPKVPIPSSHHSSSMPGQSHILNNELCLILHRNIHSLSWDDVHIFRIYKELHQLFLFFYVLNLFNLCQNRFLHFLDGPKYHKIDKNILNQFHNIFLPNSYRSCNYGFPIFTLEILIQPLFCI